jgi:hypothetical protein
MSIELNDSQKQAVRDWVGQGNGLSEVQRRLSAEFGITATFMDVRFLIIELGLKVKEKATPPTPVVDGRKEAVPGTDDALAPDRKKPAGAGRAVSVQVDRVTKPNSLVSGTVIFSDGVSASWMLDQVGRLMINASRPGYKPKPADLESFQTELRTLLETQGF